MAFQVELRSREQILGDLVRAILINTDLTDVAAGSSLAVLLEAIAESQFQISVSALKILENTSLESLVGTGLDKKAESIKLPNGVGGVGRKPSSQASGAITVGSSFSKVSSKMYAGKPAPFAGSNTLFLEDASSFPASGSVYIGRGTLDRFEGPISYSSVTNNGSFWTINLTVPITKSHLHSDLVTLAQGGDRTVPAGTIVQIPANNQSPAVSFTTTRSLTIPDGESEGSVQVVCTQFGEIGNALAGSISQFSSAPFSGATVRNPTSYKNGNSTESDEDLRQRIKTYPSTLSRGTASAILAAIQGASDPDTGRTIQSAIILEPVEAGDNSRAYIDDGSGLEPNFSEQSYEQLLESASGQETRFRAAQFPITAAVAEGSEFGPFVIENGQSITVHIDEISETYTITGANYKNLNSATGYEVVRDLNSQSNIVGFRTLDGGTRIAMFDLSGKAEILSIESGELQATFGFPTAELRPIFLYQNSQIKSFRGHTASLETRARSLWGLDPVDLANVIVIVDGVPQTVTITNGDFIEFQADIGSATIVQWAEVLSRKIAGVKFTVSGQILVWSTYQDLSASGSLEIAEFRADGTPAGWVGSDKMWTPVASGGKLQSVGAPKDFKFNRFTGEITLIQKPEAGDTIEVGSRTTRAQIPSVETPTGLYSLSPLGLTVGNARLVLGFDGEFAIRNTTIASGSQFTPSYPDLVGATNVLRLTANTIDIFGEAEVGDWLYLVEDASQVTWPAGVEGFYRIKSMGLHKYAADQNLSNLTATTDYQSAASASVLAGSSMVRVSKPSHGYKTGDLITVSTASSFGGISAGNLSVTNAQIYVIDGDNFYYYALAYATSNASGVLANYGTNVVKVTQALHGFESGAQIDTTAGSAIGGISSGNLSVANAIISKFDINSYQYRAASAATSSASGLLTTVVYNADAWLEFELSAPQIAAWSGLIGNAQNLSSFMINLFKSTSTPQLVDFGGAAASETIDSVVSTINSNISGGKAVKINPRQFAIRSSNFASGTAAVLASVGNSSSMLSTGSASSIQAHIAYSPSAFTQAGFPVVKSIELPTSQSAGYPTRTYLKVDKDLTDVLDEASNPSIQSPAAYVSAYPEGFEQAWLTGRSAGLYGRVYNNQTASPYSGILRGENMIRPLNTSDTDQTSTSTLDRYSNFGIRLRDLSINNKDKLVVEMDLDPVDKTVAIPMAKLAKVMDIDPITGSGKGQVISLRLKDPEDGDKPFFDPTSIYKNFDFADFKILTKSVGLYREDASDRALILRSTDYAAPNRLRFSIRLPVSPSVADFAIAHTTDYSGIGRVNLFATLPSSPLVLGSTLSAGSYKVVSTANATLFDWRITAGSLNSGLQYAVGDVLNIAGSSDISGSYEIIAAGYVSYPSLSATTTINSAVVTVSKPSHGFTTGDFISVTSGSFAGITGANLSQSDTPLTVIDPNTFSYVAGAAVPSDVGVITTITRPQIVISSGQGDTTNLSSTVKVTYAGHGLVSGNIVNVTTSTAIGGISAVDLSVTGAVVTVLNSLEFTYTASAAATSTATGTIDTVNRPALVLSSVPAQTTPSSATVQLTYAGHGLQNADSVNVTTTTSIGGISAINLSVTNAIVVYVSASQFQYPALVSSPSLSGTITTVTQGKVTVKSAGSGGLAPSIVLSASQNQLSAFPLLDKSWQDLADAINDYLIQNPVASAAAIGTNLATNPILHPTYIAYPASSAYSGSDMSGALLHHSFECKLSGSAGIWQYDSSNASLNNIKATVQSDESIFPTVTEATGTSYSPINEEVYIVPTNSKTLTSWLDFNAASSLNLLANIERINSDNNIQISSKEDGSSGAVRITGVSANGIETSVIGNATTDGDSTKISILSADAKPLLRHTLVKVQNTITSEIQRSYRTVPSGASVTSANTTNITSYFRSTNSVRYVYINQTTARIIFQRNGIGNLQTEPLAAGNTITLASLGSGLVQVTGAQAAGPVSTGKLSARVGDMMYIKPLSALPQDSWCKTSIAKYTVGTSPEYVGYPVVHVIDENNVVVIAPNITTFGVSALTSSTDLVYIPAIWNEKNIRTNKKEGAKFFEEFNNNNAYAIVKSLGGGIMSVWMQNSSAEATDTMRLSDLSVGTDDSVIIGTGFDPANQGTFRVIAHNGKNHILFYNSTGGRDEVVDTTSIAAGGNGSRKWRIGPLDTQGNRPIRILDGDSVRVGDYLRISTPPTTSQWFPDVMIGSWKIKGIGMSATDLTAATLPYSESSGSLDEDFISPYIDIELPNGAPLFIPDSGNAPVASFLIGGNDTAIGFTEGTPFEGYRIVDGHGVNPLNAENSDVFLVPKINTQKMSATFGTIVSAFGKSGFAERTFQGIDGYKVFAGLVREAHRIIDGLPTNTILYPGVKAVGTVVEVLPPLIKSISISLQVRPKDGVTLNSISEVVKSTVASYVNGLGVGRPVVMSEIIRIVQGLSGVFSVTILSTLPTAQGDRIPVSDSEKPFVLDIDQDITVG